MYKLLARVYLPAMKIVFLAPGLGRVKRGTERFFLELSGELRKCGLDAVCWGTSEGPGVEAIPVPSRIELEEFAKSHLQRVPNLPPSAPQVLQTWALYTEDQLFAIPAAMRIRQLLDAGESVLVYVRWQGGLTDPSGDSTELLKVLSATIREGKAALLVHTDYAQVPVDALWDAGACFHTLGPWLTASLRRKGITPDAIVELPMCIDGTCYRSVREEHVPARDELGIPSGAFVILSVGTLDLPAKRHDYILDEIQKLGREDVWWVVAGSRGPEPAAWEADARRALGGRFVPLTDVPFERMPRVYAAADLCASASLYETFGLVYLEAQMAGLPIVAHDTAVTRHLFAQLPEKLRAYSLADMRTARAAASAISHWMTILENPTERDRSRAVLESFAQTQERQFSWKFMAPAFAAAFRSIMPSDKPTLRGDRRTIVEKDEQLHKQGIQLFEQNKLTEALACIARSMAVRETADRWNDWATVQSALGSPDDAEQGFRRALAISPNHAQAGANLGAVLAANGRFEEAVPLLEKSIGGMDELQRPVFARMIETCRGRLSAKPVFNENEIAAFLQAQNSCSTDPAGIATETVAYCTALLNQIPAAASGQRLLGIGDHGDLLSFALRRFNSFDEIVWCSADRIRGVNPGHLEESHKPDRGDVRGPLSGPPFDVVVLSHVLESIADDPMRVIAEMNRILKPRGKLLISAANIGSAYSLQVLLRGGTPYVDGRFSASRTVSQHREYTASELETLANAGGFGEIRIVTYDVAWKANDALMASLASSGFSVAARGDTIFLVASKESGVRDRFPAKLYDLSGIQSLMDKDTQDARLRILVIFETLPMHAGGGADHRLLQVIRLLREQGHAVTFFAPRASQNVVRNPDLTELGVDVRLEDSDVLRLEGVDAVGKWTLQEVLREGQFDLAIVSLWFWMGVTLPEYYVDEIRRLSPATRIAILSDDYHGLREQGGAEISGLWSDRERAIDFAEREMESYRSADFVISISSSDRQKIEREIGKVPVEMLPMMIESDATERGPGESAEKKNAAPLQESASRRFEEDAFATQDRRITNYDGPGFDGREGIVYLGNFNNRPTLDGLEWYIREVMPLVRKELPDLKLYVVGSQLPEDWSPLEPNVIRVGYQPDLAAEFAKYRILVSPVRFGTGIKTKNLHAIAHGLPVVTNTKGADGASFVSGETALIADDPKAFAAAVVKLYSDRSLWERLSNNSRAHAKKHFSKEAMDIALRAILERVRSVKPKPYERAHVWSMRLVENMFAEVTTYQPARDRRAIRLMAYSRAAEVLLAQGNRAEARRQLRHVFNYLSNTASRSIFFGSFGAVAESMERTYRALGETKGADEFRREARRFSSTAFAQPAAPPARSAELSVVLTRVPNIPGKPPQRSGRHASKPDFSVVLPTYNRANVLAECLGALNRQTLPPRRFEVIVVDDGSVDGTHEICSKHNPRHGFHYLAQQNAGAGAARRLGVEHASGKYLLLINDDTIASPELLTRHFELQRAHTSEKLAVLGHFYYAEAAKKRALTWFLRCQPFLFPQIGLKPGIYTSHTLFITCNISVRRDWVISAGSFDPNFRVAEDTELGIRLVRNGLRVLYAPEIESIHDHLDFKLADLIRRAEIYGKTLVHLFRKHPDLLADGKGVLGTLDGHSINKIDSFISEHAAEIPAAMASLTKFDSIDFLPFFSKDLDGKNAADAVMDLFARSIPTVYWYHLFRSFLKVRDTDRGTSALIVREAVVHGTDA